MTTITKERIELFIKNPLENGLTRGEQMELARIALASLEAEPVAKIIAHYPLGVDVGKQKFVQAIRELPDFGGYLFAAPPAPIVPEEMYWQDAPVEGSSKATAYATGWNDCREAMLQSGNFRENKDSSTNNFRKIPEASTSSPVTPALLPGGFTIEEAKELHEDLVRSHISKALSGEKMKKKDRDADLRWIHGVIVQAAWFVKASLEQNALSGNYPVTPDGWISCSELMPDDGQHVIILCDGAFVLYAQYRDGEFFDIVRNGDEFFETQSRNVTDWMQLPEPPL
ncbi:TPA: DUF551 domain-containing protein [Escherichia coli]|nr:hypothetical protein ECDEC11D_1157 [Escherichia coli DEC11D]HAH3183140.1 DUF551 domain-containing protein [Escherichia coli]